VQTRRNGALHAHTAHKNKLSLKVGTIFEHSPIGLDKWLPVMCLDGCQLLKRGLSGSYLSVEPFHLFRYVDEQYFRYNNRIDEDGEKLNDSDRFAIVMRQIVGKRLTYAELTGKEAQTASTDSIEAGI
jgi:hypothetical protein